MLLLSDEGKFKKKKKKNEIKKLVKILFKFLSIESD